MKSSDNAPSKRPYPTKRNMPQLQESIVLTADILGFSNLVMESAQKGQLQKTLNRTWNILTPKIRNLSDWGINQEERPFEFKVFADNIVIGWPILQDGESEFEYTVLNVAYYQLELILDGLFVRGAMDMGPAYIDDYLTFGPPIVTSHRLETEKANYPRIILSEEVEALIYTHLSHYGNPKEQPQNNYLLRDFDKMLFIDYLNVFFTTADSIDDKRINDLLSRHKQAIQDNLYAHDMDDSIKRKLEWSCNYHNNIVERYLGKHSELIISVDTQFGSPTKLFN